MKQEIKISSSITPRESQSLPFYLVEIAKLYPLQPEEEVELAYRIRQGDIEARNRLVAANTRFVLSVAKQYQNLGLPLEDLISEGNIGLIEAAERFDPTVGTKFISYAVSWVHQRITSALSSQGRTVRLPQNVSGLLSRLRRASSHFEQENEREPTAEELSEMLDISPEKVTELLQSSPVMSSLDAPLSSESDTLLVEMVGSRESMGDSRESIEESTDARLIEDSLRTELLSAVSTLNRREQTVILRSFGLSGDDESTLDEIADELHLSRERVRQIREQALRRLRAVIGPRRTTAAV